MTRTAATLIGIYGQPNVRKTTQLVEAAKWLKKTTGRNTLWVSVETSGADRVQPGIDAGFITPLWLRWNLRAYSKKLCRGEWPGTVPPDAKNKLGWGVPDEKFWSQYAACVVEGTSTMGELILQQLGMDNRRLGEDVIAAYTEENESLAGVGRSHYRVAQDDLRFLATNLPSGLFQASKGKIEYVFLSGHESKGEDDVEKKTSYGIGTVGSKGNINPRAFSMLLHFERDAKDGKLYAYFMDHPDSQNFAIMWPCKRDLPAHPNVDVLLVKKGWVNKFELTWDQGLASYLQFRTEAQEWTSAQTKQMIADLETAKIKAKADAEAKAAKLKAEMMGEVKEETNAASTN